LLGAVVGPLAGLLDEEREGCEKSDVIDVGTCIGRREKLGVAAEKVGHGVVVALTEEVGFADGLLG
jgi:hypothetical protein